MTSQCAVSNYLGVALASDSAVTIGNQFEAQTFDSVNKVHPIEGHKIAIMISDSPDYTPGGYPWSQFAFEFTKSLGGVELDSVDDYAEAFIKWADDDNMYNSENNDLAIQTSLAAFFHETFGTEGGPLEAKKSARILKGSAILGARIEEEEESEEGPEEIDHILDDMESYKGGLGGSIERVWKETERALIDDIYVVYSKLESIRSHYNSSSAEEGRDKELIRKELRIIKHQDENCKKAAEHIIREHSIFGESEVETEEIRETLSKIFQYHLVLWDDVNQWTGNGLPRSKVAMAGFGSKDTTPVIVEMVCGPWINRKKSKIIRTETLRIRRRQALDDIGWAYKSKGEDGRAEIDASAIIRTYATKSEIENILLGIHPRDIMHQVHSRQFSDEFTYRAIGQASEEIFGALQEVPRLGEKTQEKIMSSIGNSGLKDVIQGEFNTSIHKNIGELTHWRRFRFREIAKLLPVIDIAKMAGELVSIEKRLCYWLSPVRSVGGEIEVYTITREDGVVKLEPDEWTI